MSKNLQANKPQASTSQSHKSRANKPQASMPQFNKPQASTEKPSKPLSNKLQIKDLITVGIFSAINLLVMTTASLLALVPIVLPLLTIIVPIAAGIPFMLFIAKVKKFGMVLIMSALFGLLMLFTGMGIWTLPISLFIGLICEFILKSGNYKSIKRSVLVSGVFSISIIGNFMPFFFVSSSYVEAMRRGYGDEYTNAALALFPEWSLPLLIVACFVGGIIGGLLGRAVLKKHFIKAGIV